VEKWRVWKKRICRKEFDKSVKRQKVAEKVERKVGKDGQSEGEEAGWKKTGVVGWRFEREQKKNSTRWHSAETDGKQGGKKNSGPHIDGHSEQKKGRKKQKAW
jgi:hypothetical protein